MTNRILVLVILQLLLFNCAKAQRKDYYVVFNNGDTLFTEVNWAKEKTCKFVRNGKSVKLPADSLTAVKFNLGFCESCTVPGTSTKQFYFRSTEGEVMSYYGIFLVNDALALHHLHFRHKTDAPGTIHKATKRELMQFDYQCHDIMKELLSEVKDSKADKTDDKIFVEIIRKYNALCEVRTRTQNEK